MAETAIEWTQRSWNPIVGCSIVSPGCTNCYAMKMAARLEAMAPQPDGSGNPHMLHYGGTTTRGEYLTKPPVWTGKVARAPERTLLGPLCWQKPTTWFVNSMGDLFHEDVPDAWIDEVFAVMALCPQHTFQVLTKRAGRMREYLTRPAGGDRQDVRNHLAWDATARIMHRWAPGWKSEGVDGRHRSRAIRAFTTWPLPNVWLGVSAEDQRRADERIPDLLATPAAVRFVSAEPLLGPIDFETIDDGERDGVRLRFDALSGLAFDGEGAVDGVFGNPDPKLDWIIVGGESGPGARPMHPAWARQIRDQCAAAGTAFFFKQWGEWQPREWCRDGGTHALNSHPGHSFQKIQSHPDSIERVGAGPDWVALAKVGKKRAGRILDGAEHNAMPEVAR